MRPLVEWSRVCVWPVAIVKKNFLKMSKVNSGELNNAGPSTSWGMRCGSAAKMSSLFSSASTLTSTIIFLGTLVSTRRGAIDDLFYFRTPSLPPLREILTFGVGAKQRIEPTAVIRIYDLWLRYGHMKTHFTPLASPFQFCMTNS